MTNQELLDWVDFTFKRVQADNVENPNETKLIALAQVIATCLQTQAIQSVADDTRFIREQLEKEMT